MEKKHGKEDSRESFGISIILSTLPLKNEKDFIKKQFVDIFENYKLNLIAINSIKESNSTLYKPIVYTLFGQYDIIVLSLVDDMEFATKTLMPYNHLLGEKGGEKYKFKIISGIIDKESNKNYQKIIDELKDGENNSVVFEEINNSENNKKYPFFSITNLTINPLLIIGNGGMADKAIKEKIENIINNRDNGKKIKYVIVSSFTFNELTLLLFSDSLNDLYDVLRKIRKITIADLKEEELIDYSLGRKIAPKENFSGNHVFANTTSQFGYDIMYLLNENNAKSNNNDKFNILFNLALKPGHTQFFYNKLKTKMETEEHIKDYRLLHSIGKNDILVFPEKEIEFDEYLKVLNLIKQIDDYDNNKVNNNLEHISSTISFEFNDENSDLPNHLPLFNKLTKPFKIKQEDIIRVSSKLKELGVSLIHSQQIISVFSMYNTYLDDFTLFPQFMELSGFMNALKKRILDAPSYSNIRYDIGFNIDRYIENEIKKYIEIFIEAFRNRYSQSFETLDLTESNVTYKGGVHQLLSGYDAYYKLISSLIFDDFGSIRKLAYLSIHKSVKSAYQGIRLNYFHVFQPSMYLLIAGHESANFIIDILVHEAAIVDFENFENKSNVKWNVDEAQLAKWVNFFNLYEVKTFTENNFLKKYKIENNERNKFIIKLNKDTNNFLKESGLKWNSFRYLIADYYSYKYTYFEDFELFSFWHWVFFLQMPNVYYDYRTLRDNDFVTMYLRIETLRNFVKAEKHLDILEKDVRPLLYGYDPKSYTDKLDKICEVFSENEKIKNAFMFFRNIIDKIYEGNFDGMKDNLNNQKSSEYKEIYSTIEEFKIKRDSEFNTLREKSMKLSYLYLMAVKKLIESDESKNKLLYRNIETGEVKIEESSGLCINSRGGLFVHGEATRREYFNLRINLMKTLWHISNILKLRTYEMIKDEE